MRNPTMTSAPKSDASLRDLEILDEDDFAAFERKMEERARRREAKIDRIAEIFAATPAVRGKGHYDTRMAIKSGELADRKTGDLRVTFFGPDGPHGHVTVKTDRAAAEAVLDFMNEPFSPMTEEEVIAWTTTPMFERGSRIVAIIQAENTLRYLAGRAGRSDWAYDVIRQRGGMMFDEAPLEVLDAELDRIAAAIRELPVQNPRVSLAAFARNPAWVTSALAEHYELLDDKVPARWLPHLKSVTHSRKHLLAEFTEFGCGAYGCVLATNDPNTVLKVTSDETEAEFAATMANDLVAPICVAYHLVVRLNATYQGAPIHLLWREAADHVGQIQQTLTTPHESDKGWRARLLIDTQHEAAQRAYAALREGKSAGTCATRIYQWVTSVEAWLAQTKVPELHPLARGILDVWKEQHVLFGDIHAGNLGFVPRRNAWVITDPGNIAVIEDPRLW